VPSLLAASSTTIRALTRSLALALNDIPGEGPSAEQSRGRRLCLVLVSGGGGFCDRG
jgi:hypothetical protein